MHAETTKLADKIEVFLPTLDDRDGNQVEFRGYVAQIALPSPLLEQLREYRSTDFDGMEPLRSHLATVLAISTR